MDVYLQEYELENVGLLKMFIIVGSFSEIQVSRDCATKTRTLE